MKPYYDRYWSRDNWPDAVPRGYRQEVQDLSRIFARWLPPRGKVLDAGCGDGSKYAQLIASNSRKYVGVDISPSAIDSALGFGLDARVVDDLSQLPFSDGEFDACVSVEVLEHLVFPGTAVAELHRVLRPGGVFVCTVPNIVYWRRRLDMALIGRWHPGGHPEGARYPWRDPHLRFFTRTSLERMLREATFDNVLVTGINGSLFGDLPFVARRFGTHAASRPFRFLQTLAPSVFAANLAAVANR